MSTRLDEARAALEAARRSRDHDPDLFSQVVERVADNAGPVWREQALELCRDEAQLHVDLALEATSVLEARKRGLGDSRRTWEWRSDRRPVDISILRSAA